MTSNDADIQTLLTQAHDAAYSSGPVTLVDGVLADYLGDNDDPREVVVRRHIRRVSEKVNISAYDEIRQIAGDPIRHSKCPLTAGVYSTEDIPELSVSATFFTGGRTDTGAVLVSWHPATGVKPYGIRYYMAALTMEEFTRLFGSHL